MNDPIVPLALIIGILATMYATRRLNQIASSSPMLLPWASGLAFAAWILIFVVSGVFYHYWRGPDVITPWGSAIHTLSRPVSDWIMRYVDPAALSRRHLGGSIEIVVSILFLPIACGVQGFVVGWVAGWLVLGLRGLQSLVRGGSKKGTAEPNSPL